MLNKFASIILTNDFKYIIIRLDVILALLSLFGKVDKPFRALDSMGVLSVSELLLSPRHFKEE